MRYIIYELTYLRVTYVRSYVVMYDMYVVNVGMLCSIILCTYVGYVVYVCAYVCMLAIYATLCMCVKVQKSACCVKYA